MFSLSASGIGSFSWFVVRFVGRELVQALPGAPNLLVSQRRDRLQVGAQRQIISGVLLLDFFDPCKRDLPILLACAVERLNKFAKLSLSVHGGRIHDSGQRAL